MSVAVQELTTHWEMLRPILTIRDEDDYDRAIVQINALIDEVGTDEAHPLYGLLDTLGTLIYAYEEDYIHIPPVYGIDALVFLMEEHGLQQSDLSEIGSQGVVSELLSGKRQLNVRQIQALASRFGVSPAVFL
ncbi:MAG: helix-turn-helix domain-containing protein [Caldilineaceae bacterium]